jgi:hypothetical protein
MVVPPLHLIGIWFAGVAASNCPLLLARVEFLPPGRNWDPPRQLKCGGNVLSYRTGCQEVQA